MSQIRLGLLRHANECVLKYILQHFIILHNEQSKCAVYFVHKICNYNLYQNQTKGNLKYTFQLKLTPRLYRLSNDGTSSFTNGTYPWNYIMPLNQFICLE